MQMYVILYRYLISFHELCELKVNGVKCNYMWSRWTELCDLAVDILECLWMWCHIEIYVTFVHHGTCNWTQWVCDLSRLHVTGYCLLLPDIGCVTYNLWLLNCGLCNTIAKPCSWICGLLEYTFSILVNLLIHSLVMNCIVIILIILCFLLWVI